MFNPPKLHQHDFNLLPPDAGGFMAIMASLIESTVNGGSAMDAGEDHRGIKNSTSPFGTAERNLFNFSIKYALDAIFDHQMNSHRVLVLYLEVAIIVVYGILFVVGLITNGLVCFVVFRQCGKKNVPSQGPSPRNLYIVNLAFADIIMCMVCIPFTLWALMSRRWTWGLIMCKTVPAAQGANITVSACTITAIALDRLKPLSGRMSNPH